MKFTSLFISWDECPQRSERCSVRELLRRFGPRLELVVAFAASELFGTLWKKKNVFLTISEEGNEPIVRLFCYFATERNEACWNRVMGV